MREILFRGKCNEIGKKCGQWIEGFYAKDDGKPLIAINKDNGINGYFVDPSTVGQFTGVTDKNGEKIFEGDIVKHESGATVLFHKVVFERRNGCAYFGAVMGEYETWGFCNSFPPTLVEVVGNIYDNPELLEVSE